MKDKDLDLTLTLGSDPPRPYSVSEMRHLFMERIGNIMNYWVDTPVGFHGKGELRYRMEGMVHSLLVMFDGCSVDTPAFDIVPSLHEDDQKFHISQGENYWSSVPINECQLHELWNKYRSE